MINYGPNKILESDKIGRVTNNISFSVSNLAVPFKWSTVWGSWVKSRCDNDDAFKTLVRISNSISRSDAPGKWILTTYANAIYQFIYNFILKVYFTKWEQSQDAWLLLSIFKKISSVP